MRADEDADTFISQTNHKPSPASTPSRSRHYTSSDIMDVLLDIHSTLKSLANGRTTPGPSSVKSEGDLGFIVRNYIITTGTGG